MESGRDPSAAWRWWEGGGSTGPASKNPGPSHPQPGRVEGVEGEEVDGPLGRPGQGTRHDAITPGALLPMPPWLLLFLLQMDGEVHLDGKKGGRGETGAGLDKRAMSAVPGDQHFHMTSPRGSPVRMC